MEIGSAITQEKASQLLARRWGDLKALFGKSKAKVIDLAESTKNLAKEDTRRSFHALKMGLALTIVSLLYSFRPLYDFFGENGMSSLLTVVALSEFTVGATVSKILNAGLAKLLAGGIGLGAQHLATLSGDKGGELILIGIFVFLIAAVSTFSRFFPRVKTRYDYGISTFIMTFTLVSVSSYRVHNISQFACERLLTTIIGGVTCIIISIFVRPVWASEDLHKLVARNIRDLASCLEAVGGEYFQVCDHGENNVVSNDKLFLQGYKSAINSKTTEENLANFASWEPNHGRFRFHHPWKQYLKIGDLTRECAYRIEALNDYLNSDIQAAPELKRNIQESCRKMSSESGKSLKKLSSAMDTMKDPSSANPHVDNAKQAVNDLIVILKSAAIPDALLILILTKIVMCVEKIAEAVHELSRLASFEGVDEAISVTGENPGVPPHEEENLETVTITVKNDNSLVHAWQPPTLTG